MSMSKIKSAIEKHGFAAIRYTIDGAHKTARFTCPYTAMSKAIDLDDMGMNPVVVNFK